jgi:hypothetical protein
MTLPDNNKKKMLTQIAITREEEGKEGTLRFVNGAHLLHELRNSQNA